jgi:hypothetical protein
VVPFKLRFFVSQTIKWAYLFFPNSKLELVTVLSAAYPKYPAPGATVRFCPVNTLLSKITGVAST